MSEQVQVYPPEGSTVVTRTSDGTTVLISSSGPQGIPGALTPEYISIAEDIVANAAAALASEQEAAAQAGIATAQAGVATTQAGVATTQAIAAAASAASAASALDFFDDRYLGAFTAAPTLDNDGNPLVTGALYFNSVQGAMYVWSGTSWVKAATTAPALITGATAEPTLTLTQTGAGYALLVEDAASPDSTPFIIDAAGLVGVGKTPAVPLDVYNSAGPTTVQIESAVSPVGGTQLLLAGAPTGYGTGISFQSRTAVGGSLLEMARIVVDGEAAWNTTVSTQDAYMRFFTAENGVSAERLRITSAGLVGIGTTPSYRLHVAGPADNIILSTGGTGYAGYLAANGNNRAGLTGAVTLLSYSNGTAELNNRSDAALLFSTNSVERMRIDNAGKVGIGAAPQSKLYIYDASLADLNVIGDTSVYTLMRRSSDNTGTAVLYFDKTRGTSASPTAVSAGDGLGVIQFRGRDGSTYVVGAQIYAVVDNTPGAGDMPTSLLFYTTADGASATTERMRINSSGNIGIGTSNPTAQLHLQKSTTYEPQIHIENINSGDNAGYMLFKKTRAGAIVQNGDIIGSIGWYPWDGAASVGAASIAAYVDGVPGSGDMPGRLVFSTTPDGGSSPLERVRISADGTVGIGISNTGGLKFVVSDSTVNTTINPSGGVSYFGTSSNHPLAFITNNAQRMVISASGQVGIGDTPPAGIKLAIYDASSSQVRIMGQSTTNIQLQRNSTDTFSPDLYFFKARGTVVSGASVSNGDMLGATYYYGFDGAAMRMAAAIQAVVDGDPGSSDMPGRLVFSTTPDGSASSLERMRIDAAGNVGIGTASPANTLHISANSGAAIRLDEYSTAATGASQYFVKSRGVAGAPTAVANGDTIGVTQYFGWDGAALREAVRITAFVDGAPGSSDMPGGLSLFTSPDGSATVVERMRIDSTGLVTFFYGFNAPVQFNAQAGSYVLVMADSAKTVEISNGSANTLTVPLNSSVAFPIGTQITVMQTGSGQTTITPAGGVTINSPSGLKLRAQWSAAVLTKRGTDTWVATGDLVA